MSTIWKSIRNDDMVKHSFVMVILTAFTNIFNYLFQLSMGRFLSVEQYGIFLSCISIITILMAFSQTIMLTVAKHTSKLRGENKPGVIGGFWRFCFKKSVFFGLCSFVVLIGFSPLISWFLKTDNLIYPIVLSSTVLVMPMVYVNWGALQGLQRFLTLGYTQAFSSFLNVVFGVLLVYIGWQIYGGLAALSLSFFLVLLITSFSLNKLPVENERTNLNSLGLYATTIMIAIFSITVITNVDVILARHYLSTTDAGYYSALSTLGRVAFYAPIGIGMALFPKASTTLENGGNHGLLFRKAVFLALLIVVVVVLLYALFPKTVLQIVYNGKYNSTASYLFKYGLAMALFALSYLSVNYSLSLNRGRVVFCLLVIMVLQVILLSNFHSSINQFVDIMLACGVVCIISVFSLHIRPFSDRQKPLK